MDRRVFLRETFMGAGVVALGFGGLWARRAHSRSRFTGHLFDSARPVLDRYALTENDTIPEQAKEKFKAFVDGMCLNVEGFLAEINAPDFRQTLRKARNTEHRHRLLLGVYYRRVQGDKDILEHVRGIALQFGPELDNHWNACCREIAERWQVQIHEESPALSVDALADRLTPLVKSQVDQAVRQARVSTEDSSWLQSLRSLGARALLTGREIQIEAGDRKIALPEFLVTASRHVFGKALDLLGDPTWDCQKDMTTRLSNLGLHIAAEFEKETRRRLNDLHFWREQAVRLTAENQAADRIGYFGEHA